MKPRAGLLTVVCVVFASRLPAQDKAGVEFFEKKIRPVLMQHCYECHSADAKKLRAELLLDTRGGMLNGGETGPAVVPGKPAESLLLSALRHEDYEMPPSGKLPKNVIADFEKWISMGAPDPRRNDQPGVVKRRIDIEEGRKFWAFQPIRDPMPPQTKNADWPRDDIDRFVLSKLEERQIIPVGDADRLTLIRRVYFDLVGLPPRPEEVDAFLSDKSDKAFERVVDRLLASPHFGERWGRHWLDIAHYAESNGNVRNFTLPHAWRYRDWVIQALNDDLPYDQFVTQQLAGDMLPGETPQQRNAQKTATGFLTMMSKPQNGPTLKMDVVAEQIEVATRAFMGLTVSCARCHDHKFDPIPTKDYYALAGIFTSSQTLYGGTGANGSAPKTELHVLETGDDKLEQQLKEHREKVAALKKRQTEIRAKQKNNRDKKEGAALKREARQIANQLKALQAKAPKAAAVAMGVRESGNCNGCQVYLKGEKPVGQPIPRGFVTVATLHAPPTIPDDQSGRLEFAHWLTRGDHPLTARVMVNRIWHHLFGSGIVRTVDNFGINGERPTHPELLDYLATQFVREHNWSVKKMIRAIVLTRTYQLSADHDELTHEADPENLLLWQHGRRRLEGEAIRDAILASSGQLDPKPPSGSIVGKAGDKIIRDNFTVDEFRVPSIHRSVYLPIVRNGIPEMLNVFDFADASLVVGRRDVTTVPAQELFLMNSPFVSEQSEFFAKHLLDQNDLDTAGRIDLAYRRALSRPATTAEVDRAADYLEEHKDEESDLKTWTSFCQALYICAEFRYTK